jgi:sigma-B regulation protein RsbU (phosphoserine phosphatase)
MKAGLGKKLVLMISLFSLVLSVKIGYTGYRTYMKTVFEQYEDFAVSILKLARSYIDADDMQACFESGEKSEIYHKTQMAFNNIKETTGITWLYFYKVRDGKMVYYVVGSTEAELAVADYINTLLDEDELEAELLLPFNAPDSIHVIPNKSEYGYMMSALVTISNSKGEVIGALGSDIDMLDIESTLQYYMITVFTWALIFTTLVTLLMLVYLRKRVIAPVQLLSKNADNFINRNVGAELTPIVTGIKTGDEIETLAVSMEKMTVDLITYIRDLTSVTAEKERIGAELDVATKIQASMLPYIFPAFPERSEFDIYASMLPAKEVGGDFYDFFLIDDSTLAVVMADVSGKGIPAALFMVIARTLIRNNAQYGKTPNEVFETVNNILYENNDAGMFVTAFMGYLDINTGEFTFVNAGHNPPAIRTGGGKYEYLKTRPGLVLAGRKGMSYKQSEITLQKGDELFLYTDGITEAQNNERKLFSDPRLITVINNCLDLPLKELTLSIKHEIDEFAEGAEQADDITMLALRYHGISGDEK